MREINFSADDLVINLLALESERGLCLLDSGGVSHLGSHLLIAGINPVETLEISEDAPEKTLAILDEKLAQNDFAAMMTISYDFGLKLNGIEPRPKEFQNYDEPDVFLALFDALIVHDYDSRKTFLTGNENKFDEIETILSIAPNLQTLPDSQNSRPTSNFKREEYLAAIEKIQEFIRRGDTYQTNLTQQIRVNLPETLSTEAIFKHLRKNHPAPFASFICRRNDVVISQSPERFFKVENEKWKIENDFALKNSRFQTSNSRLISVSPIKGTRRRGKTAEEDGKLRNELLNSEKDRAENVMIVDLLRNDIGRICEFGSVEVEKLCDIEEYPTLFHLVSTVSGSLRENIKLSDILRATFPCGSITGAPKIRTMRTIDELETAVRGLSMGAIGIVQSAKGKGQSSSAKDSIFDFGFQSSMDFSVAIRTMVVRDSCAVFNVGGGITIDSVSADEYEETLVKAKALLEALNAENKF